MGLRTWSALAVVVAILVMLDRGKFMYETFFYYYCL